MSHDGSFAPSPARYRLRLFIAGMSPRSQRTIDNLRRICRRHIADRFDLEVIDIYQQPELAQANKIVAAPTLLKLEPLPLRRIIGDLSDEARVLHGLGIQSPSGSGDEQSS